MFGDVRSCGGVDASVVLMYRIGLFYANCMILMLEPISEKKSSAMAICVIVWQVLIFGVGVDPGPACPLATCSVRVGWTFGASPGKREASNTNVLDCTLDLLPLRTCEAITQSAEIHPPKPLKDSHRTKMAAVALPSSSSSSSMGMDDVAHSAAGAGPGQAQTNMAYTPRKFPEISIAELP